MNGEYPDLSILIVSYNCSEDVARCVASVRRHVRGVAWEILIRDNASTDVASLRPLQDDRVHLFEGADNPGFGIANNHLGLFAKGEFVVCLNPDTILESDALTPLVEHLRSHRECGAVGLSLRLPDDSLQFAWAPPTDLWWDFCETHYLQGWYRRRASRWLDAQPLDQHVAVGFVSGACVCMRRDLFLGLGGFDPAFFMNHEDVDLCDRVRAGGHEVHLLRQLVIRHNESTTQRRNWRRFAFHRLQGKWLYVNRRYRGWKRLLSTAMWWEAVALRLLLGSLLLRGIARSRLHGYRDAILWVLAGRAR